MCVSLTPFVLDSHLATLCESNCPFGFLLVMFPVGSSYFMSLMSLMGGVG